MTADSVESNDCPSAENLCAWFDGELVDEIISKHVDGCLHCKTIVKSYKRIDSSIQENLERPTQRDLGILGRIKDSSMEEIKRTRAPLFGTAAKIKTALFLVVIVGLLGIIYVAKNKRPAVTGGSPEPVLVEVDPVIIATGTIDKTIVELANANKERMKGLALIAVGTNPERLEPIDKAEDAPKTTATVIKTFASKDPSHPLKLLKAFMTTAVRERLDEAIFETADYSTVIVEVVSPDQSAGLDELFEKVNCTLRSKSEVAAPAGRHRVRYSFILTESP